MAETALPVGRARRTYLVRPLTTPSALRPYLEPQRPYAAFAIAHLAPRLFPLSRFFLCQGEDGGWGIVFYARSGAGPSLLTLGEAEAVEAGLRLHPGPRYSFATCRPEHLDALRRHFLLSRERLMYRMGVTADGFRPPPPAGPTYQVVRLRPREIGAVNRLYGAEGGFTSYPARVLEEGVYYGVVAAGRLVAIAGTHVFAPEEGVAVVGNVYTHPDWRGRGLATLVTGAVTQELLRSCSNVYLTVETENAAAVQVYRKLGYRVECTLYETPALRREPLGLLSLLRRAAARWRGRSLGAEVVVL
ncbi:MAG: GNAT family N-acetyltransferase [Dehalococcoidia bacterium]|nr:GNAT family N-acetyltransferase [Dehalococcoidia bacterium]MDW8008268.1 GNAT family N-acetyltransferase [Chloroflexota bacterium]